MANLSHVVNTAAAGVLAPFAAMTSTAMVLVWFARNDPGSVPEGWAYLGIVDG